MRQALAIALGAMLTTVALAAPPASAFHRNDWPLITSLTTDGDAAFGVRIDTRGSSFAVDLEAHTPIEKSRLSAGVFLLNQARQVVFGFAFTSQLSPDRVILVPLGGEGDASAVPDWLEIEPRAGDGETDARALGLGITATNPPPGSYYYVMWVGGGASSVFEVRGGADVVPSFHQGTAHVLGDPEITNGDVNAQVQHTPPSPQPWLSPRVGAKVIRGASAEVTVEDRLYGFWGDSDFKLACQFDYGIPVFDRTCVWKSQIEYYECRPAGLDCLETKISWKGPDGSGTGRKTYGFLGSAPGEYSFTIDEKTDLYGPRVYDANTRTFVSLGEDFSYLTAADVSPP